MDKRTSLIDIFTSSLNSHSHRFRSLEGFVQLSLQLQLRKKDILRLNENNHVCARRGPEPCTAECKHRAWWCANATPTAHGWYASFDSWTSPSPSSEWPYVSAKLESNSKSIFPSFLDEAGGLPMRVPVVLCLKVFVLLFNIIL